MNHQPRSLRAASTLPLFPLLGLLGSGAFGSPVEAAGQADSVTFGLAPGARTVFTEVTRHTKFQNGTLSAPVRESRSVWTVLRTGDGFSVTLEPSPDNQLPTSTEAQELIGSMFGAVSVTYDLGSDGSFIGVRGADEIADALRRVMGPKFLEVLQTAGVLNLEQAAEKEWITQRSIGFLYGESLPLGTPMEVSGVFDTGSGGVPVTEVLQIDPWPDCPTGRCVKIVGGYTVDDERLAARFSGITDMLVGMLEMMRQLAPDDIPANVADSVPTMSVSGVRLELSWERIVDPVTGLPYEITQSERTTGTMSIDGEAIPLDIRTGTQRRFIHR